MTKVAYLIHSAAPSGAELALLRALRVWPADVQVEVYLGSDGELVADFRATGHPVHVLPMPAVVSAVRRKRLITKIKAALALLCYAWRVRRCMVEAKPDVVVAGSLKSVVYGRLATVGLRTPFVWSIHDRLDPAYLGRVSILYARGLPRVVDGIIVNSQSTLDSLSRGSTPVLICPPGQALKRLERPPSDRLERLAILGRLSPWKGQDRGIDAFAAAMRALGDRATLDIAGGALFGETEYEADLRRQVTRLDIADRVTFHGHQADPTHLLRNTDVLLHTSVLSEPFGSVVLEGMDHGCLVIATRPGGPAEVIEEGVNGFLVPAGDAQAMAAAIEKVAALTPGERDAIRAAARRTVERYAVGITTTARVGFIAAIGLRTKVTGVVRWEQWEGRATPCASPG